MAESFLAKILERKRAEVARAKRARPLSLADVGKHTRPPFGGTLTGQRISLIAEIKRASPSKGDLNPDLDPGETAAVYERAGAAAVSVLTDQAFFKGELEDIESVRAAATIPVLRKDFIIDRYQVIESVAAGASAVLLIAAALDDGVLEDLLGCCKEAGIECLVEVHDRDELDYAQKAGASIIGVNSRDLVTFEVNAGIIFDLLPFVEPGRIVVAESGVQSAGQVQALSEAGVHAVLVGEALVTAGDVGAKVRELFGGC